MTTEKLNLESIISLERFSSLQRLIPVTGYVLRLVSNLKRKKANNELIKQELHRARELTRKYKDLFLETRNVSKSSVHCHC